MIQCVTYNTQWCTGRDGVTDVQRIVDAVRAADVICLQEVDRYWRRSGDVDQVRELTNCLPGRYWAYGAGVDLDASFRDTDGHLINRRRQCGRC
ncbi:MAG: hypothetical protein CL569_08070 [Alphaproteobacteria bacterium]|nr:hypothetical protein [Alphaproteobacteria bacterium]